VLDPGEPAVGEICRRLDGMPLAIELAAARVNVLSVAQIAARLEDRFQLLTGGGRTTLPRHQTLRAALDWSHDLLADDEQALLRALSVFAGGFALEAAEAVCSDLAPRPPLPAARGEGVPRPTAAGQVSPSSSQIERRPGGEVTSGEVLDLLARLVDKSLVIAEERGGRSGSDGVRYRMLETVRQYATEQLAAAGEAGAVRERHALWCLALAEVAWPHRAGPDQTIWFERLAVEHDNLRAALGWCLADERGGVVGLQLAGLLWVFWEVRGHLGEGRRWLTALLERVDRAPPDVRARALEGAGWSALDQGDFDEGVRLHTEGLALRRELGDEVGIAGALNNLGVAYDMGGDHARARELYEECLVVSRTLGDPMRIASALMNLGIVSRQQGDADRAAAYYGESLALMREMGNTRGVAIGLLNLGHARQDQGALDAAVACYRESLSLYRDLQDRQGAARCLQGTAGVAIKRGEAERAARFCGAAAALREAIGIQLPASGRASFDEIVAAARTALGEAAFEAAWAAGQALSLEEAIDAALAEVTPA
jgi:non-specific serine/threonine protein kinase